MALEGRLHHVLKGACNHIVRSAVLLLIDGFQLTLEQAEHGVNHTLRVQFAPLLQKLWRERVVILRAVPRRRGIQTGASVLRYEPFELVGNGVVGSPLAQSADVMLDGQPLTVILCLRQFVVFHRNGVEPHLLSGVVDSADFLRTLEQHMLQIVGDACIGTVLGACLHHQLAIDLRLRVVLVEPDGQSVAQLQFPDVESFRQ